jgi:hypothetical protein
MAGTPSQASRTGRTAVGWRSVTARWLAFRMEAWAKALARLASSWDQGQGIGNESAPANAFPGPDASEAFAAEAAEPPAEANNDGVIARNYPTHWLEYVRERSPSLYGAIQARSTKGANPPMGDPARTGNTLPDSMAGIPSQDIASHRTSAGLRIGPPVIRAPGSPISRPPVEATGQAAPENEARVEARERLSAQPQVTSEATEPVRYSSQPGMRRSAPQAKAGALEHGAVWPTTSQAADQSSAGQVDISPSEDASSDKPSSPSPHHILLKLGGARNRRLPSVHPPDSQAEDPAARSSFVSKARVSAPLVQVRALEQPLEPNLIQHDVENSAEPMPSWRQDPVVLGGVAPRGPEPSTEPTRGIERTTLARGEQVAASRRGQYGGLGPEVEGQPGIGGEPKSRTPIPPRSARALGAPTGRATAGTDLWARSKWPSGPQVTGSEEPVADPWPTLSEIDPLADCWDEEDAAHQRALQTHERRLKLDREQRGVLWNE